MKRDDPNWKHKKYHTGMHGEEVEGLGKNEIGDDYIETVQKVKKAELDADIKRWSVEEEKCDDCTCEGCGPDGVGHEDPCVECGGHHKLDEAVKGQDTQDRKDAAAERRKGIGKLKSKKEGEDYAKWTMRRHPASVDEQVEEDNKKKAKVEEQSNPGDTRPQSPTENKDDPTLVAKEKKISQMKKMVLLKKMQAVRSGAGSEITASYEPEGEVIDEGGLTSLKATTYGMPHEKRKAIIDKYKKSEKNRGTDEKQGRDAGALARERLKKEGFSNWRNENLTENGNKGKPGYVNIGMGVWVKKEDAEKKKAQLAKSVRGENIPGFKRGRID